MRVRLPPEDSWATVREYLVARLSGAGDGVVERMMDDGLFVGVDGESVAGLAYEPGMFVWFHRELPVEVPVPFPVDVVYRDEHIVVADKPHFLATTPRGSHVVETALARLRRSWGSRSSGPRTGSTDSPPGWCCSPCDRVNGARTRRCSGRSGCGRSTRRSRRTIPGSSFLRPCAAASSRSVG